MLNKQKIIFQFLVLLFALGALIIAVVFWLLQTGNLSYVDKVPVLKETVAKINTVIGGSAVASDPVAVLDQVRLDKQEEVLQTREKSITQELQDLQKKNNELALREEAIIQKEENLIELEKTLREQEKTNENRSRMLQYNAQVLINMPPESAVKILKGYDDLLLIDIIKAAEDIALQSNVNSIVPYWLSLIEPARAAELQKKMTTGIL